MTREFPLRYKGFHGPLQTLADMLQMRHFKAGDLVFFSSDGATPNHVGVYIGENRFLHAEKRAGRVIITDLNQPWYVKHFLGAPRVVGVGKGESTAENVERAAPGTR